MSAAVSAAGARRGWRRWLRWRPLPIFVRFFFALVVLTIAASILFGVVFGSHQERVTANTLAALWTPAIRAAQPAAAGVVTLQAPLAVHLGAPPANAYSVLDDQRTRTLVLALEQSGVQVREVLLDDDAEMPVTWLAIAEGEATRWVGFEGGVQPGLFRTRSSRVLLALLALMAVAAWFASRWVARPLAQLSHQLDAIGRGEVPSTAVTGPREIARFGAALASTAQQRAAYEEERRTMLMGVSHDLRSPLTRIRVAADLLEQQPSLRDLIVRNVEHADAIIESFLMYVRTEAEPVDAVVDLGRVVQAAARLVPLPDEAVRVAPDALVRGNETLLQRLVTNLLENALKHGAPPVVAEVLREGERVVLRVTDAGAGIVDPERMLRPFERGDASRGKAGAGLGLAIVARIVARHGGELLIDSGPQGGARVAVRLPAAARGTLEVRPQATLSAQPMQKTLSLLPSRSRK
jgi:two-component system osmolarity sensor histidine kinase EnvZ